MTSRGRLLVVTSTWPLHSDDPRTPFVRDLAQDLAALGWQVRVLAPHAAGAARSEMDGAIEIRRFRYMYPERLQTLAYGAGALINMRRGFAKWLAAPFVVAQIMAIRAEIVRFGPQVVHAHWLLPQGFTATIATLGRRVPVVTTIHGGDVFALKGRLFRFFKRFAVARSAALTANGHVTRDLTMRLGASAATLHVIPFAPSFSGTVDVEGVRKWRLKFPQASRIILFVGRLIPEKGPEDFLRAIALTGRSDIYGVLCGDGPLRATLADLARELGIEDQVTFAGWLSAGEIAQCMQMADALLFPSKASVDGWVEAQGIVLVEAMRAGLPALAAASGGIPDLLEHGRAGWLFAESDTAEMARLIVAACNGTLPAHAEIMKRAKAIGTSEITRATTAASFDRLFVGLRHRGSMASQPARTLP